jgi:mRNA interferase RelE/StbE
MDKIGALADDPHPPGCEKLAGTMNAWRIRSGNFRVVYVVDDRGELVTITWSVTGERSTEGVGHRREIDRRR